MGTLWVLQTNEQAFLDDCRDFQVYGVRTPKYMGLEKMHDGDTILLRLRLRQAQSDLGYLGPYRATSQKRPWVKNIENVQGIWQKVVGQEGYNPRWLKKYPWCVFLSLYHFSFKLNLYIVIAFSVDLYFIREFKRITFKS